MNVQQIRNKYQKEIYKKNLELKFILKNANISNKIIDSKIKKREELYKQFKLRQSRLEIARINSELMNLEKIFKIERKHLNRDINNKYRNINQILNIYSINKYYNNYYYNYMNKRMNCFNNDKEETKIDINNKYNYKNY